jgi:ribose 5-phosphate isomerase A
MDTLKKKAANAALKFIKKQMIVGLGTGSTTNYFIDCLIEECKKGLCIKVVASSLESEKRAQKGGLEILDINEVSKIDVVVDGADEVDCENRMIKGGGGALLKEKILASCAKRMIVIIDESKMVKKLGSKPLPIEVVPFGYKHIERKLKKMKLSSKLRMKGGKPFVTENHNLILDLSLKGVTNLEGLNRELLDIVGVVETGFFLEFNPLVICAGVAGVDIIE